MRALLSVFDKKGITTFAQGLIDLGWELISTGGTLKALQDANIPVLAVEEVTQAKEILGGRVKTLHPVIHGGILNRRANKEDQGEMDALGLTAIDMVVNNLYPFEATVLNPDASEQDVIENIDIGGPSMIRAAAKNYEDVIIVTDPVDYEAILAKLQTDQVSLTDRQYLATKAFQLTAYYDSMIAQTFMKQADRSEWPAYFVKGYRLDETLRYGENPHQAAAYYVDPLLDDYNLKQLHGKQLSYNNYNDMKACLDLVSEFSEPVSVAIKHNNPCGVAIGDSPADAYAKAYAVDPHSIYGGIVGFNREVDAATAEQLSEIFLEIVVAPSFSQEALDILTKKKNIRLMEVANLNDFTGQKQTAKEAVGGLLVQDKDLALTSEDGLKLVSEREPSANEVKELEFAWKIAKHISSNGMVVAKDGRAIGLGHGEVRRVWALEKALERSEFSLEDAVVASDGFFFADTIETLNEHNIKAVIQPGGSIQDEKVITAANEHGISVLFTGMRHFKH